MQKVIGVHLGKTMKIESSSEHNTLELYKITIYETRGSRVKSLEEARDEYL